MGITYLQRTETHETHPLAAHCFLCTVYEVGSLHWTIIDKIPFSLPVQGSLLSVEHHFDKHSMAIQFKVITGE